MTGGRNAEEQIISDEPHNRFHADENNTAALRAFVRYFVLFVDLSGNGGD